MKHELTRLTRLTRLKNKKVSKKGDGDKVAEWTSERGSPQQIVSSAYDDDATFSSSNAVEPTRLSYLLTQVGSTTFGKGTRSHRPADQQTSRAQSADRQPATAVLYYGCTTGTRVQLL